MQRSMHRFIWAVAAVWTAASAWAVDDPWADAVVSYTPNNVSSTYANPNAALGVPLGGGATAPNNGSIVGLGAVGGSITLKFNTPVIDDPENPDGLDCIVFSNCLWSAGNPQVKFQEPAIIEISKDVNGNGIADDPWYLIPGSRDLRYVAGQLPVIQEPAGLDNSTDPLILSGGVSNPNATDADPLNNQEEYNWGYGEMTPTAAPYLDNYVRPDDPHAVGITKGTGGGDAFDIATAVDADGNPAGIDRFSFIRLTTLVDRSMLALGPVSSEIEAVADVAPEVDTDGDGILDDYEIRVAGTDPNRPENTVLPLEIPSLQGGSSPGTVLGTAEDARGTRLRLFADQARTGTSRHFSVNVDLTAPVEPGGTLPDGLLKSGTVREVVSTESDFVAAGIQTAQITLHYTSAEIAGLDETALQPYRYDAGTYTQDGISEVMVNETANLVTFRSRYAGIFLLAATAGSGDATSVGPQGTIALHASPLGAVADPAETIVITSDTILDDQSTSVADGTLFTVTASQGAVVDADASSSVPGRQVASSGGVVSFTLTRPEVASSALITVSSVGGAAYGELEYAFLPGPPAGAVALRTVDREIGDTTIRVEIQVGPAHDAYGNTVQDGTALTVTLDGATFASADGDLGAPGQQVILNGGLGLIVADIPATAEQFTAHVFQDPAKTMLLTIHVFEPIEFQELPAAHTAWVVLALIAAYVMATRKRQGRTRC